MNTPSLGQIAAALGHAKKSGGGYMCSCPCHDEKHASLSITRRDGKLLFKCHAGCEQRDLADEFRRRGWLNGVDPEKSPKQIRRIVATFPYVDEAGDLLYEVVRYEPKDFRQRRQDGNGDWIWKLGDTRRVLYRLPELLEDLAADRTIFVVEGERKVDLLRRWNFAATCNSGGAEKWLPEFSELFRAADAVLLPDNDTVGRKHVEAVAASLAAVGASVRVLDLPGLGPTGDIVNWAAAGGTAEQLLALVESARQWRNGQTEQFEPIAEAGDVLPPAFSEDHLALVFVRQHGHGFRYVADWGKWLAWTGAYWRAETTLAVFDLARKVCRAFAVRCNKHSTAKAIAKANTVAGVERLAKADRTVAATFDQWDTDEFLLNMPARPVNLE